MVPVRAVAAVAAALRAHPRLRVTVEGDAIRSHEAVHVGIAVALDEGLIVPVIRDTDKRGILDLARESRRLVDAARAGKLKLEEFQGPDM